MAIEMKFYNEIHPKLKPYLRHYWVTYGALEDMEATKLLPMDHIDIIIPTTGNYKVIYGNDRIEGSCQVFFYGMRNTSVEVVRHDYVECFGVSFQPWGFYPFMGSGLSEYFNRVVDLEKENDSLARHLKTCAEKSGSLRDEEHVKHLIEILELGLLKALKEEETYLDHLGLLKAICSAKEPQLEEIGAQYHVTVRTIERLFKKYIGITPRGFFNIKQFEEASRLVLFDQASSMTDIAYDSRYYDQAHFSKKFKQFTEETPKKVRKNKSALKSHMNFK